MIDEKLIKNLQKSLKIHAKALGIAPGAAEIFIEKSLKAAEKSLKKRSLITEADLTRATVKELKKYQPDLAYVLENYDKII